MIAPSVNPERAVQNRIIKLLEEYNGYEYLGNFHDTENGNILKDKLQAFLMDWQDDERAGDRGHRQVEVDRCVYEPRDPVQ